jgi:hypothetical protein
MNWNKAEKKLRTLAKGRHFFMTKKYMEYPGATKQVSYSVYIGCYSLHTGSTFEAVIKALEREMSGVDDDYNKKKAQLLELVENSKITEKNMDIIIKNAEKEGRAK